MEPKMSVEVVVETVRASSDPSQLESFPVFDK
jgi:hypothetical protein